jgi:hypothetical protein
MTTPTGTISASDIRTEFGATSGDQNTGPVSLGAYRISQTVSGLSALPLDTGVPQSVAVGNSAINFDSFRGKKLNIVVDCTPAPNAVVTRVNAKSRYDNNTSIAYIGNFASKPASTAGKKVYIHTNGTIGSDVQSSQTYCSLLTGSWDTATELIVDIGPNGKVFGAGGNGGQGRAYGSDPTNGGNGTSAIGITKTNNTNINNRGTIVAGGGGGGGGGGALQTNKGRQSNGYGGGGGGGNGYPSGTGGSGGSEDHNGGNGTETTGGDGGGGTTVGQTSNGGAAGGGGGGGGFDGKGGEGASNSAWGDGSPGGDATSTKGGDGGAGNLGGSSANGGFTKSPGTGGENGYAIIISGNKSGVSFTGTGTTIGSIVYFTNPV